jgi:hypothetical protein
MGSGRWSAATFTERVGAKARAGKDTFHYSERAIATGQLRPHQTLDPGDLGIRESRDSHEHPTSNAIIISLDVTGSMGRVVRAIHSDLPRLHELILGHGYIADPQIMFAAVGDATCDSVPLQVGQFESDNRMDENLENMILEGGGGPGKTESYELMLYLAARHTAIDCWEKRHRKGYLFIIGDEVAYPSIKAREVQKILGGNLQADLPLENVIEQVRQRYHAYCVIPGGASHGDDSDVLRFWRRHLGAENVIKLESPEDASESIGLTIGINENRITINDGPAELRKHGVVSDAIDRVCRALASLLPGSPSGDSKRSRRL